MDTRTYKLTIECNSRDIAEAIQHYINRNYNDDEILYNAIK